MLKGKKTITTKQQYDKHPLQVSNLFRSVVILFCGLLNGYHVMSRNTYASMHHPNNHSLYGLLAMNQS